MTYVYVIIVEYVDRMSNNDSCGQSLYSRPVNTWRAGDVYTWITKELGLNQYGRLVSENIKSGTVNNSIIYLCCNNLITCLLYLFNNLTVLK